MNETVTVLLSHQTPEAVGRMLDGWSREVDGTDLVLAYGGPAKAFGAIPCADKLFIDDARLRTRDHQRERQSYTAIFREVRALLADRPYGTVWFMEFDHLPARRDAPAALRARLAAERADVLGFHLCRVDGTNSPHFLNHAHDPGFFAFLRSISVRDDPRVTLSMFGSGSFWTREAFDAVAAVPETFPIYLEIYLPTVAHHLGFRLRDLGDENRWVRPQPTPGISLERARGEGALTVHPDKEHWLGKKTEDGK